MKGKKNKFAILGNEDPFDHLKWIDACEDYPGDIDYKVFDLTAENWLEDIQAYAPDLLLLKPPGKSWLYRNLYQERLEILVCSLNYKSFPSIEEVRIYENKRYIAYWLKAHQLPHPKTWIYYNRKEALQAAKHMKYPLVGKMNIGSAGNGVQVHKREDQLIKYIEKAFSKGLVADITPNFKQKRMVQRVWNTITRPAKLKALLKIFKDIASDYQKGFIILQEFVKHDYEWRAVRIGDSFFAHKKLVLKGKASGSLEKEYCTPPKELLNFVRELTDQFNFRSVAIDLFEPEKGQYLINEIQCIFGQSDPYQMIVDENPGRYRYDNGKWAFEKGDFNTNKSYDLRLKDAIETQILN
jgi:hypothetical protein